MTFRIIAEPRWWLIQVIVNSSEYVSIIRAAPPHHLHSGLIES